MKLGDIPQVIVVFVCPPPRTKTRTQKYVCKFQAKYQCFQHAFFKKPSLEARFQAQFHLLFTKETFFHSYFLQGQMDAHQILVPCSRKFYFASKKTMCFSQASKTNDQWIFLLKANKLCFINQVICTALQKNCSCLFNLITPCKEEVVLDILHELQLLLGQHLYISSLLVWICPLENFLSPSLSWNYGILLNNTVFLHMKLQLLFFEL